MTNGSKFLRADLHIHSFGEFGSYDVVDHTMTPEAIVDVSIEKGLSIISITDHNEIQNCNAAITYGQGKEILIIPGIEVSTTQGHLLLYFGTFKQLRDFYGKLTVNVDKKLCQEGIVQCLNYAQQNGGLGILAHIEVDSGFEKAIGRYGPQIEEVFKHPNLYGLEINTKRSIDFFNDNDTDANRKRLHKFRNEELKLDETAYLPKLMSSDAHTLNKLGTNADGENKLTRIKVDQLDFHSFKVALISHESRIRLEDFIPEQRPVIKSITIQGGLLDKVKLELSSNLTCIIGSRGAGKSTLLEALRETSGNKSTSKVVNSDVWPQTISLIYEDEAGQNVEFRKEKFAETQNITDPVTGIRRVEIESYGQGETAATLQHSDENPLVLLNFLDTFLDIESLKLADRDIVNNLLNNQSESRKLRLELLSLDETKRVLQNEKNKLASLEKEKAGELVKYQNALMRERQIRKDLIDDLRNLIETYKNILSDNTTFDNFESLTDQEIIVGKDYFQRVKEIVSEFSKIVSEKSLELQSALNDKITELRTQLKEWGDKEKEIQEQIDKKKLELEAQGIPFDLGKINQISKDIIELTSRVKSLENSQKVLEEFEKERKALLNQRAETKRKIYYARYAFSETVNKNLRNTMDNLFIDVKFDEGKCSEAFESQLKSLMDWRTSQVPKAPAICKLLTPLELVDACKRNDVRKLKNLKDSSANRVLSDQDIATLVSRMTKDHAYEDFESIDYDERPSITVTKLYNDESGVTQRNTRSISQLSLGQQQSVLLGILMLSRSNKPLIIDQPEDNLDSEFIFKTIVTNLRKIKEARQVIIVTHNPNIAVLGDAELIVPLKSTSIKSQVLNSGSIDRKETREICCEILEGGRSAFKQRQAIYGI